MIGAVLTLVLAGAQAPELRATLEPLDAAGAARARDSVRVGDPVRWSVVALRPRPEGDGGAPELVDPALATDRADLGLGWAIVDGPRTLPGGGLRLEWTLLPLESGVVRTPAVAVRFPGGGEATIPEAVLEVAPALGPDEDQARPLPGFRDVEDRQVGDPRLALLAALLLIVGPIAVYALWIRRGDGRRRAAAVPEATPEEQIAALAASLDRPPEIVSGPVSSPGSGPVSSPVSSPISSPGAALGRLGPLARRAIDARDGLERAGLTDDEWAIAVAEAHAGSPREEAALRLGRAVTDSSAARFAGLEPTAYAVREALDDVRAALDLWGADAPVVARSKAVGGRA